MILNVLSEIYEFVMKFSENQLHYSFKGKAF